MPQHRGLHKYTGGVKRSHHAPRDERSEENINGMGRLASGIAPGLGGSSRRSVTATLEIGEVPQQSQPVGLALFGVELGREQVIPPDHRTERIGILGFDGN